MYIFKKYLYTKSDSLYVANNFMLSIINCYLNMSNFHLNIYLYGDLGVGKTFFVNGFLKNINCIVDVKSPTYNIYNEYFFNKFNFYHFDLYRIKTFFSIENFFNLNNSIYLFEWPDNCIGFIKNPDFIISISFLKKKRYITIESCSFFSDNVLFVFKNLFI